MFIAAEHEAPATPVTWQGGLAAAGMDAGREAYRVTVLIRLIGGSRRLIAQIYGDGVRGGPKGRSMAI
jgi:hypothetical protein